MFNVVRKKMLPCNHLSVSTFKFHLKILFKKSPQRAGYHLVKTNFITTLSRIGFVKIFKSNI
jgi:hypothetical protein